jgi:hypothetical protein
MIDISEGHTDNFVTFIEQIAVNCMRLHIKRHTEKQCLNYFTKQTQNKIHSIT